MLLQGNLREFSLPNVFQLVKMSAKTGALTISSGDEVGKIYFKGGMIYFATAQPVSMPLGERLVKAGHITGKQLKAALAEQRLSEAGGRIGNILMERGDIDRATLEQAVREQIEDVTFNFFAWTDGEFAFEADETVTDEDILVEMNVESVIMEGCRRIDEWELIFEKLGSLERVAHLVYADAVEEEGVSLTPHEWKVVCCVDGRRDINTVLKDCGLDRFNGAKVIYSLHSSGLLEVGEARIDELGTAQSILVRGPIDVYNQIFVNTLGEADVSEHLRVELIDDSEVEIPMMATQYARNGGGEAETLVFTAATSAPEEAWKRLASQTSAFVVLANINSTDSLRASARDLQYVLGLADKPVVVATYVSMDEESLDAKAVNKALSVSDEIPVMTCDIRQRESVLAVVKATLEKLGE